MKKNTITIGRDKKCDLVVPDIPANGKVSGSHATIKGIENDNGRITGFVLEDHSTNGTYVNSKFVHNGTFYIKESDMIKLGSDYVLDWGDVLPLFGIRITREKPMKGNIPNSKGGYESPDPVYPDNIDIRPVVDDKSTEPKDDSKRMEFTKKHWIYIVLAYIAGVVTGLLFI